MLNEYEIADFSTLEEVNKQIEVFLKAKKLLLERELNKINNLLDYENPERAKISRQ